MPAVPLHSGDVLRTAAKAHRDAMQPASYDERKAILREVRLATVARNESELEARASFEKLINDLVDVPADILKAACRAYVNEPGTRFFPRGTGELRTFTDPMMRQRSNRAYRLGQMAEESDHAFDPANRCTPEQAEAIKAEFGLVTNPYPERRKDTGAKPRNPTREDYIALGVSPEALDRLPHKSTDQAA